MGASWKEYEENAAQFFRELGLEAVVGEPLRGARDHHDVDVVVRMRSYGIQQVWIVDCKLWQKSVSKGEVSKLRDILEDVGADHAFLLSEAGFQAGAIRLARHSPITLTNLAELTDNAQDDLLDARWMAVLENNERLGQRLRMRTVRAVHGGDVVGLRLPDGVSTDDYFWWISHHGLIAEALPRARIGAFPVGYGLTAQEHLRSAEGMDEFLAGAEGVLDQLERWLDSNGL